MSVKVIFGWSDPEFPIYENVLWNFTPDDWDYMIIGDDGNEVKIMAEKLMVFHYEVKHIGDRWYAVTYHS